MTMKATNKSVPDLYQRAVAYILTMPKTEKQMRQWYARKTMDQTLIENDIARLREYNFINDEDYAHNFVQCKRDKLGIGQIKNKLRMNGINSAIIEKAVAEIDDQRALVQSSVEKYLRHKDKTPEIKSKLFRWLLGKGFNYDVCVEVIDENWH